MPRPPIEENSRMSLRISARDKAMLLRAVALQNTSLTDFVLRTAVTAAQEIINEHERLQLSERDSLKVLDLLENPPEPNEKLQAAAGALPDWR